MKKTKHRLSIWSGLYFSWVAFLGVCVLVRSSCQFQNDQFSKSNSCSYNTCVKIIGTWKSLVLSRKKYCLALSCQTHQTNENFEYCPHISIVSFHCGQRLVQTLQLCILLLFLNSSKIDDQKKKILMNYEKGIGMRCISPNWDKKNLEQNIPNKIK